MAEVELCVLCDFSVAYPCPDCAMWICDWCWEKHEAEPHKQLTMDVE